jgi:hypothetical protein
MKTRSQTQFGLTRSNLIVIPTEKFFNRATLLLSSQLLFTTQGVMISRLIHLLNAET